MKVNKTDINKVVVMKYKGYKDKQPSFIISENHLEAKRQAQEIVGNRPLVVYWVITLTEQNYEQFKDVPFMPSKWYINNKHRML